MTWFVGSSMEAEDNALTPGSYPLSGRDAQVVRCYNSEKNSVVLALMLLALFPSL